MGPSSTHTTYIHFVAWIAFHSTILEIATGLHNITYHVDSLQEDLWRTPWVSQTAWNPDMISQ